MFHQGCRDRWRRIFVEDVKALSILEFVRLCLVPLRSFKDHSTEILPSVVVCSLALSDDDHRAGVVVRLDGSCKVNGNVVSDIAGVQVIDQFAYSIINSSTRLPELLKHADKIEAAADDRRLHHLKKSVVYSTGHLNTSTSASWRKEVVTHAGTQTRLGFKRES